METIMLPNIQSKTINPLPKFKVLNGLYMSKLINLVWSNLSSEGSTGPIVILFDNGFLKVAVINVDMNG